MMVMGHFNLAPGREAMLLEVVVVVEVFLSMVEDPTLVSVLVKDMEEVEVILMTTKRVAVQDLSFLN